MVSTRGALAILGLVVLLVGVFAMRRNRHIEAGWLLTAGFAIVTVWGVLSVLQANEGDAAMPTEAAISFTTMGAAITLWFLHKAINRMPVK